MEDNFDYKKYLKNNPLYELTEQELNESILRIAEEMGIKKDPNRKPPTQEEKKAFFEKWDKEMDIIKQKIDNLPKL